MNKNLFARLALFIIYFWFGILKVASASPAGPLVVEMVNKTIPFISPDHFLTLFGLFEMLIGILFLFPKFRKIALGLFIFHMITTFMPLILLPHMVWESFLTPTLEGQYIIKNLALIATALHI